VLRAMIGEKELLFYCFVFLVSCWAFKTIIRDVLSDYMYCMFLFSDPMKKQRFCNTVLYVVNGQ
jgi:hypothetical protein